MAEKFFSIIKQSVFADIGQSLFSEVSEMIDPYIHFNYERIQFKTGEAPLARRLSA